MSEPGRYSHVSRRTSYDAPDVGGKPKNPEGVRLKVLREDRGILAESIREKLGYTDVSAVSNLEKGRVEKWETRLRLAEIFDVSVELLGWYLDGAITYGDFAALARRLPFNILSSWRELILTEAASPPELPGASPSSGTRPALRAPTARVRRRLSR